MSSEEPNEAGERPIYPLKVTHIITPQPYAGQQVPPDHVAKQLDIAREALCELAMQAFYDNPEAAAALYELAKEAADAFGNWGAESHRAKAPDLDVWPINYPASASARREKLEFLKEIDFGIRTLAPRLGREEGGMPYRKLASQAFHFVDDCLKGSGTLYQNWPNLSPTQQDRLDKFNVQLVVLRGLGAEDPQKAKPHWTEWWKAAELYLQANHGGLKDLAGKYNRKSYDLIQDVKRAFKRIWGEPSP